MKIVIAPDSFKACLSAQEVADALREGVSEALPDAEIKLLPLSDGGEGLTSVLATALGADLVEAEVSDPLGRPMVAQYAVSKDIAIIESAAACGLTLLEEDERNPLLATSRGLGELILDAAERGCKRFLIGLGGSATNDGGKGMIEVPGLLEKAAGLDFTAICDVDVPFVGPEGASRMFGPQKGASMEDVELLEQRMQDWAVEIMESTGTDVRNLRGSGAAGGLGGALSAFFGAEMVSGIDAVLDILDFDNVIEGASLIVTGEGRADRQTLHGKVPSGVLHRAMKASVPVLLVAGSVLDRDELEKMGFAAILQASPEAMPLELALQKEVCKTNLKKSMLDYFSSELSTAFAE